MKSSRTTKKASSPLDLDLSYNPAPWPKPNDVLFQQDTDWSHNAFLNLGGKAWGAYANGYKEAANVLVQRFLDDCDFRNQS